MVGWITNAGIGASTICILECFNIENHCISDSAAWMYWSIPPLIMAACFISSLCKNACDPKLKLCKYGSYNPDVFTRPK